jgi:PAS domain S-box-containing protein
LQAVASTERDALELLSEIGAAVAHSSGYARVLSAVDTVVVPELADLFVVEVLEREVLAPVHAAGADGPTVAALEELYRAYPADAESPQPRGRVVRSGDALLIAEVTDGALGADVLGDSYRRAVGALDLRSLMFVPLVARDRTIGVITLALRRTDRRYRPADLTTAEALGRYLGLAIDDARLDRDLRAAIDDRRERDSTLRLLFRQLPGAVWAVDRDLRFTHANGRLIDAAEMKSRDAIGQSIFDFFGTRDATEPGVAHHLMALAGERQSFDYEFRGRWYSVLIDPLQSADGAVIGCVGAAFDITERQAAAGQLVLSQARLAEAQRTAHVGSFEWDIRSNAVNWTDELHRIYGLEVGQFAGRLEAFLAMVHPDDMEHSKAVVAEALQKKGPFAYDHRIVRADGSTRTLHTRGEVLGDEAGNAVRMVGTCWDVTELAEATQARERSLSLLQATIEATADGILVVDRDRKVAVRNRRFLSLWRIPADLVDCSDEKSLLGCMRAEVEDPDEFLRVIEDRYAARESESIDLIRFKDGRVFERYSGPQNIGDDIVGRVWGYRDISERERLLRSAVFLSDATRLLASLDVEPALDAVAHMAVPYLGDGCAIDVFGSGGPRRLIAISRDSRTPISPELHPTVLGGHSLIYQVGAISYLGAPLLIKDDLVGAITLCASPHRKYGDSDLEIAEELARRAALALDNARLYRRAQEALRARDEFLSVAAHEIRGPLTAVQLSLQSIRKAKVPPASVPRLFDIAEREGRRLSQFVDELLDLGRIREGRLAFRFETVSLGEVVRDAATRLEPELVRSGSSLALVTAEHVVGKWDRFRVEQVVGNLLSNAIKFGLGKPIEVTIGLRAGRALLVVRDSGLGIDRDAIPRLFKPFERAVSERHYGGLGLGLHILKTIVDAMGGSVSVDSEPGKGSVFTVELPADEEAHDDRQTHPGG